MTEFIPFSRPVIGSEEIAEVTEVLKSGWLTTGARCKKFEEDFKIFLGDPAIEVVSVNSCTAGLHLALEAIGIQPGDEVIVPVHTFTATAEVVRYLGADPVFVDVLPDTLCIDPAAVKKAITPKTKAIMPVHFAGRACDMDAILKIAKDHGLKVIEDAAHALPTKYNGKLVGALQSDAAVFSFYANKTITTGEGGMIATRNPDLAKRCRIMRTHGMNKEAFDRFTSTGKKPAWYYEIVAPGFKYNMPDLAAAVGIHQLKKAYAFQKSREQAVELYRRKLAGLPLSLQPPAPSGDMHAWHLCVATLDLSKLTIDRNRFIELLTESGIGASVHYVPLHFHPYWKDTYNLTPQQFPVSTAAYERIVSLPLYPDMTEAVIDRVVDAIRSICTANEKKKAG